MDDQTVTVNDTIDTSTIETQGTNFAVEPALGEIEAKKPPVESVRPSV